MMRWRFRRIVNGSAAQQLVAPRGAITPEFISYGLVNRAINRKLSLEQGLISKINCAFLNLQSLLVQYCKKTRWTAFCFRRGGSVQPQAVILCPQGRLSCTPYGT